MKADAIMKTLNLNVMRTALEERAKELARSLAERHAIAVETVADTVDAMLLAAHRETSAQAMENDSRLLRQIEAARDRIRKGIYGMCLRCEEDIAPRRLSAIPWAALCISCQVQAELNGPAAPALARAA